MNGLKNLGSVTGFLYSDNEGQKNEAQKNEAQKNEAQKSDHGDCFRWPMSIYREISIERPNF